MFVCVREGERGGDRGGKRERDKERQTDKISKNGGKRNKYWKEY